MRLHALLCTPMVVLLVASRCAAEPRKAPTVRAAPVLATVEESAPPRILAWARLDGGEASAGLLRAMARVGRSDASITGAGAARAPASQGGEGGEGGEGEGVQGLVGRVLGLSARASLGFELTRPAALALVDIAASPAAADGTSARGPVLLFAIPVASREKLVAAFTAASVSVEKTGDVLTVATARGPVLIRVRDDKTGSVALATFEPKLLGAASSVLEPVLSMRSEAPLTVHLDVAHVYAGYGVQIEALLTRFAEATREGGDPQIAFALRSARRFTRFAGSLEALELLAGADDGGVTVTARAVGREKGAFADYVASQKSGPPWGLAFVPRDAVLAYVTHRNAGTADEELGAAVDYLGDAGNPPAGEEDRAGWRAALGRALAEMPGEMVYAVWPGGGGGVGLGGAYRIRPGQAARRETLAAYSRIGDGMAGVVARALQFDPARYPLHIAVRRGGLRVSGIAADTVTVTVRWPPGAVAERALFERLFGPRLVLATAFVGEQAVFAVGRDARERLATFIAIARRTPPVATTSPVGATSPVVAEAASRAPSVITSQSATASPSGTTSQSVTNSQSGTASASAPSAGEAAPTAWTGAPPPATLPASFPPSQMGLSGSSGRSLHEGPDSDDTAAAFASRPGLKTALAFRPDGRVSLTWLDTAAMASFILRLLEAGHLDAARLARMRPVLAGAGEGAIVAATNASGARYELSTHLPASSLAGLPHIGGLFWRMALSPLINPPAMPPLPIPPAHVAPTPESNTQAAGHPHRL